MNAFGSRRRQPTLLRRQPHPRRYTIRVDLKGAQPPIWRRLQVASHMPLDRLHTVLQIAMGWTDSHLHHFVMGPGALDWDVEPFLTPFDVEEGDVGTLEADVRLDQVLAKAGDRLHYEYDFGDGWQHTITLERVEQWGDGAPDALCVAGKRACPPEDSGGIGGYAQLLEVLAGRPVDIDPEWAEELRRWAPEGFDPEHFDVDEVNEMLATGPLPALETVHPYIPQMLLQAGGSQLSMLAALVTDALREPVHLSPEQAQRAVEPYRLLLEVVGDGLSLTAAGWLPPTVVTALWDALELDGTWIGKGNREDQTRPVAALRASATQLGLVRKLKGRLLPTTAARATAGNPAALWDHIRSRVPLGKPHERDAGMLLLLRSALLGTDVPAPDGGALLADLGWMLSAGSLDDAAHIWAWPTRDVLDQLSGLFADAGWRATVARALLTR
ncbi:pRiA4b ORF-3-like protein [Agrococcus baldri]|uniref:PRiA4b ORF-3-like protein n=1 Tax=Agrococcus baldri TaxID=153730 RepID=A0AA94HPD6_9MICO|nr:plasmid pRiA4b ORF-3 family protein [Agrococcus baldri]SFS17978.1 pRiA4b ORF-3-like protein [Agrococcus baldri]